MTTDIPVTETKQGGCQCGHSPDELPELDARALPHAVRHGAILGALASLQPGAAMVLVAPHDPLPLLAQVDDLYGDAIEVAYLDRAPQAVRLQLTKLHAVNEQE